MQKSKKVVILGHFGVGKTSLIRRFVTDSFSDNYQVTIGVHITKKVVQLTENTSITLIIWDLEGTDDIHAIRDSYLLGTHGAIFVFDVARPSTFQNINKDLDAVRPKLPDVPLLVVGNKLDLVVPKDLEALLQKTHIATDFLTSAKTGGSVNELFRHVASLIDANA